MDVPAGLRYSDDHEWLRADGSDGTVGITRYAADELGDVVFVEMPPVGMVLTRGETFGVIESVKTASDLYSPVAGEVVAVNEALRGTPEQVNADAYAAWLFKLKPADAGAVDQLLDAAAYEKVAGTE